MSDERRNLTPEELKEFLEKARNDIRQKEIRENTLPSERKFENYGPDTEEDIRYRSDD